MNADLQRLATVLWDTRELASNHDPDHAASIQRAFKWIKHIIEVQDKEINKVKSLERRIDRLEKLVKGR